MLPLMWCLLFPLLQDIANVKLTVVQCEFLNSRAASGQGYKMYVLRSSHTLCSKPASGQGQPYLLELQQTALKNALSSRAALGQGQSCVQVMHMNELSIPITLGAGVHFSPAFS